MTGHIIGVSGCTFLVCNLTFLNMNKLQWSISFSCFYSRLQIGSISTIFLTSSQNEI